MKRAHKAVDREDVELWHRARRFARLDGERPWLRQPDSVSAIAISPGISWLVTDHRRFESRAFQHTRLRSAVAAATSIALSGCQSSILDPNGPIGSAEKTILIDAFSIMTAIVLPTVVAIGVFAWWFRASNTHAIYLPDWEYSGRIEMVVWGIPLLVIMLLGGVAWIGSHDLDPARPLASTANPVEIQVVSLDWKWLFIYPDQNIASVNELFVPVGVPIHFSLTSASVMSAFFIPQLGSMIYTMNGMVTQLNLQADRTGVFHGLSSNYNGDGFSDMNFQTHVVNAEDFSAWVHRAGASNSDLNRQSYSGLAMQSRHVAPATFTLADPTLFHSIVMQIVPPAPGPELSQPAASVSPRSGG